MKKRIEVDGSRIRSIEDFYQEISDKVIPDAVWGCNLDAFNDILRGGFGTPESGFVFVWKDHLFSKKALGQSTFDLLVEIICVHGPNGEESEDKVDLVLE